MQKAINTLTARIERLNEEFKKAEKISDEPEFLSDYEFALNDMANIETEIIELQFAINSLKDLNPKKNKVVLDNQGSKDPKLILHGVVGSVLLADLLKESQEVIAINGLRFTGTHEEAIKNVFDKHGINYEPAF